MGRGALQAGRRRGRSPTRSPRSSSSSARTSTSSRTRSTSSRLWAGDEPIGEHEVEQLVAAVAETPTFALTDAWAQRDAGRTLDASETIFEREGRPRRDTAPRLAGALGNHLAFMRRCQRLAAEGVRARDAASTLKRHPFYVEKVFGQAANFTEDELRTAVVRLAELDHALKGGSRLRPTSSSSEPWSTSASRR